MTIADLNNRNDLTLVTDQADIDQARNDYPAEFALNCNCDSFFIGIGEGEITEVYGFQGIVPTLDKQLHVHLIKGSASLAPAN